MLDIDYIIDEAKRDPIAGRIKRYLPTPKLPERFDFSIIGRTN